MDIGQLARMAAGLIQAPEAPAQPGAVPLPSAQADPAAVAEFQTAMQAPAPVAEAGPAPGSMPAPEQAAMADPVRPLEAPDDAPVLSGGAGDDLLGSRPVGELDAYGDIMRILAKDELTHMDLYRVQVMAGLASIETQRNTSTVTAMDRGLKTLLKDSG